MNRPILPDRLVLPGLEVQVCNSPTMPESTYDLISVAHDIIRETNLAMGARDEEHEQIRRAGEANAGALASEFVKGNFAAGDESSSDVAAHRAEAERLQEKIDGLERAKPQIVAMIRADVAEHLDEWRRDAAADAQAFLVDLTAALGMARDAYARGKRSIGALSALDDFVGRQEDQYRFGESTGNLRLQPRRDGWMFPAEQAIADLEAAIAKASEELRDRTATDAQRAKTAKRRTKTATPPVEAAPADEFAIVAEADHD